MPYTSPLRSPASSSVTSPSTSRRSSFQVTSGISKADLPRSTTYLARHRRTGPAKSNDSNLEFMKSSNKDESTLCQNKYLRQSPSSANSIELIPTDITISSQESTSSCSNDTASLNQLHKFPGSKFEDFSNLQVASIQARQQSEDSVGPLIQHASKALRTIDDVGSNNASTQTFKNSRESQRLFDDQSNLDDEDEIDLSPMSPMVRKKSGELVRPALRLPVTRRRPSSMPGTPTFSKAVHFDSNLEHIRHFLQVDRPIAVSAGSSPAPTYDSDTEFPFYDEFLEEPSYEWELVVSKFPEPTPERLAQAVRVERVFLSSDNKILIGSVVVANLAYKKSVVVRFTLDYWKTTSEVVAEFNQDSRQPIYEDHDRFNFNIKLNDQTNLEAKTMFFCVKYCVNGMVFWDNNNSTNFQVDFRKKRKTKTVNSKSRNGSLPRSNHRLSISRPRSMPIFDDDTDGFEGTSQFVDFRKAVEDYLGESRIVKQNGVRLKRGLPLDTQIENIGQPNGNAFGSRYDFGVSLSAAINASNVFTRDPGLVLPKTSESNDVISDDSISPLSEKPPVITWKDSAAKGPAQPTEVKKPGLSSQSYNDLLNKYCFFGSAKNSPQLKDGSLRSNKSNRSDQFSYLNDSTESTCSNSPNSNNEYHHLTSSHRQNQPPITSRLVPSIFPAYQNLHEGYPFLESHTATAIRGQ